MGKSNVKNQEDVRRTVKNNSSSKSRVNPALIIIAILIIVGIVVFVINTQKHKKITPTEVSNYNYFVTEIDEKYGVIDKTGKTIIEPQYEYIQIPNPEKPIFVCLYDYNVETREYNSKVLNESGKEILTQYSKVQAIPNNNTSINNSYQTNILKYKDNEEILFVDCCFRPCCLCVGTDTHRHTCECSSRPKLTSGACCKPSW